MLHEYCQNYLLIPRTLPFPDEVVYRDTNSVFINSNVTDLEEALRISDKFKASVNGCYKLLEIDLDGIIQRLLLLQKKKYTALKIENASLSTITKGSPPEMPYAQTGSHARANIDTFVDVHQINIG